MNKIAIAVVLLAAVVVRSYKPLLVRSISVVSRSSGVGGVSLRMAGGFGKQAVEKEGPELPDGKIDCPCHSSKKYAECCSKFHTGESKPDTIVEMVRSRFSALAVKHTEYLQATTHPTNKEYVPEDRKGKRSKWRTLRKRRK